MKRQQPFFLFLQGEDRCRWAALLIGPRAELDGQLETFMIPIAIVALLFHCDFMKNALGWAGTYIFRITSQTLPFKSIFGCSWPVDSRSNVARWICKCGKVVGYCDEICMGVSGQWVELHRHTDIRDMLDGSWVSPQSSITLLTSNKCLVALTCSLCPSSLPPICQPAQICEFSDL